MSKAILVIDMPESCEECSLGYDLYSCYITGESTFHGKSDKCPLKKLPFRLTETKKEQSDYWVGFEEGYTEGWNDMLDCIQNIQK